MVSTLPSVTEIDGAVKTHFSTYSPNPQTDKTIHDLLALGLTPLPVAPAFPAEQYPSKKNPSERRFNGKNPSYLDRNGKPAEVKHSQYRDKLPTEAELKEWFQDGRVGVGTISGSWLDVDLKRFPDVATMERTVAPIIEAAQWVERTQSGGYRVAVAPAEKPGFQNIGLGDFDHIGEFMNGGGFVVLAPTIGERGEYKRIKFGEPLAVDSLSDLGIRPTKATPAPAEPVAPTLTAVAPNVVLMPGVVPLESLILAKYKPLFSGQAGENPSFDIVRIANEAYGWENLARELNIPTTSADSLIHSAAVAMGREHKLEAILAKVDRNAAIPVQQQKAGKSKAIARLRKAAVKAGQTKEDDGLKRLNKLALHDFMEKTFDIRFDVWKGEIFLDGEKIDADTLHVKLAAEHGVDVGKDTVFDVAKYIAFQHEKDDVKEYLFGHLESVEPLSSDEWENIALYCLGNTNTFDSVLLRRTLISAVARVDQPGCKVDECLTFQGPQGLKKSTFWAVLAGQDNFSDELGDFAGSGKKDAVQKLHTAWIHEVAELDKYTSKKEAGELKSFLTTRVDNFRAPYAKTPAMVPRVNIFVATVNPPQFLNDPTGNRRYPVIKIAQPIDLKKIEENRDRIWAAAVQAYKNGERWWYDPEETAQINKRAESYEYEDPWELDIFNYIEGLPYVSIKGLLEHALKLEPGRATNKESARVCRILAKAGWWSGQRRRVNGVLISPWYPPKTDCQIQLESATDFVTVTLIEENDPSEARAAIERMEPDQVKALEEARNTIPPADLASIVSHAVSSSSLNDDELLTLLELHVAPYPRPIKAQIFAALPEDIRDRLTRVRAAKGGQDA